MLKKIVKAKYKFKEWLFFKKYPMLEKDETYGVTKFIPAKVDFTKKPVKTLSKLLKSFDNSPTTYLL